MSAAVLRKASSMAALAVAVGLLDDSARLAAGSPLGSAMMVRGIEGLAMPRQLALPTSHLQEVAATVEVGPEEAHVPTVLYPLSASILLAAVLFLYGPRGPRVVCAVVAYLGALSTMMISVKWVFIAYGFGFPRFLTVLHFLTGAAVSALMLSFRASRDGTSFPKPRLWEFWQGILPVAGAMALSIGTNNMALMYSSVAFTEIVASTNCLMTYAMVVALGMPFHRMLLGPLLLVAFGTAISISGEMNFSLLGMVLALVASLFRALRSALQQMLLTGGESKEHLDPLALLFWVCVPSALVMQIASMLSEGTAPYYALASLSSHQAQGLAVAVLASCANATVLNLAHLFVTKDLGAVGVQLTSQAKSVLTVLGSVMVFGDPLSWREIGGFALVLFGIFLFTRLDRMGKESAAGKLEDLEERDVEQQEPLLGVKDQRRRTSSSSSSTSCSTSSSHCR